jgi:hypothetical protein
LLHPYITTLYEVFISSYYIMPRGGHRVKPAKPQQSDAAPPSSLTMRLTRRNTDWISKPSFLSRNASETKLVAASQEQPPSVQDLPLRRAETVDFQATRDVPFVDSLHVVDSTELRPVSVIVQEEHDAASKVPPEDTASSVLTAPTRIPILVCSSESTEDDADEAAVDTFEDNNIDDTQSSASSLYSRDSMPTYSSDSASIYSSASSVYSSGASTYSSGASMYSFDEEEENNPDARTLGRLQYQQRTRTVASRRPEIQDAASRERSTLAKKAALFKNSRLPPQLPSFSTSLPVWSMICRAGQASSDCYDSEVSTRRGTYTPADTSKDIKAMIIDDQLIDESRLLIVSIRGTQFQCLSDWSVNKAANPVKPTGFLDDEENACHAGFLQVAKAMVVQIATMLQQHPASSEKPTLLFTGHSAGGAVAAMLYSHMLSTSVISDLTSLATQFSSISCVTFGAPPLSLTPLPKREHGSGVFLSFANEGDPVLRLSNAAYVKSLAKLMTTSPPSSVASTTLPVKVVRHSRGTRVIRQSAPSAPATPWEELPLWPTPPAPLTNAGDVILLRDREDGNAAASRVTSEELQDVMFADLAQHPIDMYMRRVKDVAFAAMMGRNVE